MDDQNKNLILAFALSLMVILIWFALFPPPEPEPAPTVDRTEFVPPPAAVDGVPAELELAEEAAPTAARIDIDTPSVVGSISLMGGRIDDLQLRDYRETTHPASDIVHLFNPVGSPRDTFYALYGWSPRGQVAQEQVPGPNTVWEQEGEGALAVGAPVTLRWDNGVGLIFRRTIEVDPDFLFTVTQTVENNTERPSRWIPGASSPSTACRRTWRRSSSRTRASCRWPTAR